MFRLLDTHQLIKELESTDAESIQISRKLVLSILKKNQALEEKVEQLQYRLDQMIRHRFGSRSERFLEADHPQGSLFPELTEIEEGDEPTTNVVPFDKAKQKVRKKKKRLSFPEDLEKIITVVDLPEEEQTCTCGAQLEKIGSDITDRLSYQPESFHIEREIRLKRACSCGQCIKTANALPRILPKIHVTNELLAQIVVAKCLDRQTFYHLEKRWLSRHDVNIPRDNAARWCIDLAQELQPLVNLFQDELLNYDIASLDATSLQVLKEAGRKAQTKSKVWCFNGGAPVSPVVIFDYNCADHAGFIKNKLDGFIGTLHGDADNCFTSFDSQMSYCNAHSRRKYEPISKASQSPGVASHVMSQYGKLYEIERQIKELPPHAKKAVRQKEAKPILEKLKLYLESKIDRTSKKSNLGKAIAYTLRHWAGLIRYLEDGRLAIDNNHTERIIRQFVMARNNFLFADTVKGAKALCVHFSIIQTAIANGVEPYSYYCHIMERIPYCKSVEDYEDLLPWNIDSQFKLSAQHLAETDYASTSIT